MGMGIVPDTVGVTLSNNIGVASEKAVGATVGMGVSVGVGVEVAVGLGVGVGVGVDEGVGEGAGVKVAGDDVGSEMVGASVGSTKMDTRSPLICNAPRNVPTATSSKIGIIRLTCARLHPLFRPVAHIPILTLFWTLANPAHRRS